MSDTPGSHSDTEAHQEQSRDTDTTTQTNTATHTQEEDDNSGVTHMSGVARAWERVHEGHTSRDKTTETPQRVIESVDWERRELSDHYPTGVTYHCNACRTAAFESLTALRDHVMTGHDAWTWREYVVDAGLHKCAGCHTRLDSLRTVYCDDCTPAPNTDYTSCRNCGEVRVPVADPFCSPACAGERAQQATDGMTPLGPPADPSSDWLTHPHRTEIGIPSTAPRISNNTLTCRECYEYGADSLHGFAVHVAEKHPDLGWDGYIERYRLRTCRVCDTALSSLLPLYCSYECQTHDPDPPRTCARTECAHAVERRQKYCSRECYTTARTDADKHYTAYPPAN